jgi:hypothetical protein
LFMSCSSLPIKDLGVRLAARARFSPTAAGEPGMARDRMVTPGGAPDCRCWLGEHHSIEVEGRARAWADRLGDPTVLVVKAIPDGHPASHAGPMD